MDVSSDVVENILTRSDVKDLLRWKSVCKSWYSLVSSPYFTKAHLKHHICNSNNNDVGHTRIAMPTFWKIPNYDNEKSYQVNLWKLVGSSNGLVCVSFLHDECVSLLHEDPLIFIINPWTREVRELPIPTLLPKEIRDDDISLSFGYDSSTDDYKLVIGINKGLVGSLVQVFSLKSMTWKLIGHINYWLTYGEPGVFLNGALHWFAYQSKNTQKLVMLSFDLSREEFKEIPAQPIDSRYCDEDSTLGIFEGNLCISCEDDCSPYYGMWVMRNYNDKQSWEFLPKDYKVKSHGTMHYMKIYDCTSPKKKRMTFFCNDKTCSLRSGEHTIYYPIFVQSLVSPHVNCDRPSHAGSAKVAEREYQQMRVFEHLRKSKYWTQSEKLFETIRELYWREGGQNEKSYLREGGETERKKRKRRDKNMSKSAIVEILT